MSKKKDKPEPLSMPMPPVPGGCIGMVSLMLAAPTALVALVVKGARR